MEALLIREKAVEEWMVHGVKDSGELQHNQHNRALSINTYCKINKNHHNSKISGYLSFKSRANKVK